MQISDTTQERTLEDFGSESVLPTAMGSVGSVPAPRAVSLDQILAQGIAVHWDEAVAVVEELCAALTVDPERERPVPELEDIVITNDGGLTLNGRGGTKGASAASRTLHLLLSTADVPVALRLFVTQASSPDRYASIREFAAALAYYGKPGRRELIRAIYQRCAARGVASSARPAADRAPEPPVKPAAPDVQAPKPPQRKVRHWVPVAVSVAGVLGAGIWLWSASSGGAGEGAVPSLMTHAKTAIQELGTEVRDVLVGSAPPVTSGEAGPAASPPARVSRPRATRPRADATRAAVVPPVLTPLTSLLDPAPVVSVADNAPVQTPVSVEDASGREQSIPVYSSTDFDVRPPLLLQPQLPLPLVTERRAGMVNSMELVVSESGTVMQVRLVEGPRRMPDMMLLSGAKNWKFQPAVKDGEPVRYRTVVSWSGIP